MSLLSTCKENKEMMQENCGVLNYLVYVLLIITLAQIQTSEFLCGLI